MSAVKTVLICDDDQSMRDTLSAILKRDYRILTVSSGEAALVRLREDDVDVILLDVRLPGISGFDVLRIVRENYHLVECIMISAINEVETAVQAMKHGAYHYITKDFDHDELRSLVRHACERQDLNRQVMALSAQVAEQADREFLIGPSRQIRDIVELVHKVANLSATVLILGESGTGKELLARLLHREVRQRGAAVHRRQPVGYSRTSSSRARYSATSVARSPALTASSWASSSSQPAARCFSTRSATCASTCRRNSCARSRRERSSASAEPSRSRPNSGSSSPPTSISKRR